MSGPVSGCGAAVVDRHCTACGRSALLDLFSCAGGAGMGYHRAGFCVTGVDVEPMPRFPFHHIVGDAVDYLTEHGHRFSAVHGSPPCKVHTRLKAFSGTHHLNLIPQTRAGMEASGVPWVMENVEGAPLIDPVVLCGSMFPGLMVRRHRLFELGGWRLEQPACRHEEQEAASPGFAVKRYHSGRPVVTISPVIGVYGRGQGLGPGEFKLWQKHMGIDWMRKDEMREAIPPAYTELIGRALMAVVAPQSTGLLEGSPA